MSQLAEVKGYLTALLDKYSDRKAKLVPKNEIVADLNRVLDIAVDSYPFDDIEIKESDMRRFLDEQASRVRG